MPGTHMAYRLSGAVGVTTALVVLTACAREHYPVIAGSPSYAAMSSSHPPGSFDPPRSETSTTPHGGDPQRVALAEARTACDFDWRQSIASRLANAQRLATPAYALTLAPTSNDEADWQRTEQDHESGVCSAAKAAGVAAAPNTPTVQYVRVEMTQRISATGAPTRAQPFAVQYRIERQMDGRWLVAAESDGG